MGLKRNEVLSSRSSVGVMADKYLLTHAEYKLFDETALFDFAESGVYQEETAEQKIVRKSKNRVYQQQQAKKKGGKKPRVQTPQAAKAREVLKRARGAGTPHEKFKKAKSQGQIKTSGSKRPPQTSDSQDESGGSKRRRNK